MRFFTIEELCKSDTAARRGIDNTPTPEAEASLRALVENILDPLRAQWGGPLTVTSGYRCVALNRAVGGAVSSQHMRGEAADITAGSREANMRLFKLIQSMRLPFDQLIFEKGNRAVGPDWVHVSFCASRRRGQVLYIS